MKITRKALLSRDLGWYYYFIVFVNAGCEGSHFFIEIRYVWHFKPKFRRKSCKDDTLLTAE